MADPTSFTNTYRPPTPPPTVTPTSLEPAYGPSPYDINFCYPLDTHTHTSILESSRVRLTPFIPRLHASTYISQVLAHPELTQHFPSEHRSLAEFLTYLEYGVRRNSMWCLFAVLDKGGLAIDTEGASESPDGRGEGGSEEKEKEEEKMAGVIGLIRSDPTNLSTEIGYLMTFPSFQRTHITTHAVCLLLQFTLELPTRRAGALGLRRVEWRAYAGNDASVRAAERMGFREEGTRRWYVAIAEGKEGYGEPREGDPMQGRKRIDSRVLAMCCDDWESGGREHVESLMARL
ncbi:acyl-CoA N-acyltransferase [Stereum hirsutum FP-91666 SS1]|uniref:acyl-CoA N-acyltransferase n=1 Tax=Stereum hirsutum (strain FP-91666) TaxID=721885 RepID=UPI000440F1A8|nr:acyl-CoA N-acyltransferase [Stereum hirsutum FP-91666 SS1]EIM90783.1 acyl-CoA N-acyltransferase [Stereum hirsutum FP-91666 SS1]